ncbi:hypothetical protein HZC08_01780 [Candidatus Micrarchaeota archaeon]|nr:hypothetical protein [Candidatus Micrarchaeota archaeon]
MDSEFFTPTAKPTHIKVLIVGIILTLLLLNLPELLAAYSQILLLFS